MRECIEAVLLNPEILEIITRYISETIEDQRESEK